MAVKIIKLESKGIFKGFTKKEEIEVKERYAEVLPDGLTLKVDYGKPYLTRPPFNSMGRVIGTRHDLEIPEGKSGVVFDDGFLCDLLGLKRRQIVVEIGSE